MIGEDGQEERALIVVLETERLRLRHALATDAAFFLDLLNQPSYIEFIGDRGVRTLAQAEARLHERIIGSYVLYGFGLYVVELQATGAALGMCGLIRREGLDDVDIGYAYLPQYWGQGYASEAAAAVMAYGRETLGLARIVAIVSAGNARSIRVLEKLGLRYERLITLPGDTEAVKLFV